MLTATELINNCLLWLRDPNQDWHDAGKMLTYVNRSLRDIARKSQSVTSYTYLSVLKDIFRYPLPDDFLQALIVGFDADTYSWRELHLRMDSTIDGLSLSEVNSGYPIYYAVSGRANVDRFYGYVSRIEDDGYAFAVTGDSGYTIRAPRILFFGGVKRGDKVLNVTDGSESEITSVDEVGELFRHQNLEGGKDNVIQVGDEVRIISPEQSRHVLNISPPPERSSAVGVEPLSLFYAREHRVMTQADIDNENDTLELDAEFETALERRVCQYGSTARHDVTHPNTRLFAAEYQSEYAKAFPEVSKRVREAASLWSRNVSSGVRLATITNIPNTGSPYNRVIG